MAPLISHLINKGYMKSVAYHQTEIMEAARILAQTEGLIIAPETAHCLKTTIDEALKCKKTGEAKVITFNCSGHGLLDLSAYESFLLYIGAFFVPLLGVVTVDFYVIKRKQYRLEEFYSSTRSWKIRPIVSWVVGIVLYYVLYNYTAWGSSIPSFIGSAITLYLLEKVT
jgi:hypothetical protein